MRKMVASWNHRVPLGSHGGPGLMRRSRRWSWSSRRTRSSCRIPLHLQGTEENSKAFLSVDPPKKRTFLNLFLLHHQNHLQRRLMWNMRDVGQKYPHRLDCHSCRRAPGLSGPTAWWILLKPWKMTLHALWNISVWNRRVSTQKWKIIRGHESLFWKF